jgi:site-specific DNA-methyltransferase (adenine-specific)
MHDPEVTERKKVEAAKKVAEAEALGRWPANLCHDGSDEVLAGFPNAGGGFGKRGAGGQNGIYSPIGGTMQDVGYGDSGSAARFFYCAKASKSDRTGSKHPTVKPVALMRWLVRMLTPPGGVILDPFGGSGTTGQAAFEEGFDAILIEREAEYVADIERRMECVGLV